MSVCSATTWLSALGERGLARGQRRGLSRDIGVMRPRLCERRLVLGDRQPRRPVGLARRLMRGAFGRSRLGDHLTLARAGRRDGLALGSAGGFDRLTLLAARRLDALGADLAHTRDDTLL